VPLVKGQGGGPKGTAIESEAGKARFGTVTVEFEPPGGGGGVDLKPECIGLTCPGSTFTSSHEDSCSALVASSTPPPFVRKQIGNFGVCPVSQYSRQSVLLPRIPERKSCLRGRANDNTHPCLKVLMQVRGTPSLLYNFARACLPCSSTLLPFIRTPSMSKTKAGGPALSSAPFVCSCARSRALDGPSTFKELAANSSASPQAL
jgi:hypothetical protein